MTDRVPLDISASRPVRSWPCVLLAIVAIAALQPAKRTPLVVWNASPSSPTGFYLIAPFAPSRPGRYVAAWPPSGMARLAAERGYLRRGMPLVKTVSAKTGDHLCARGDALRVNGRLVARRRHTDSSGRVLPRWRGCRTLAADELFLLGLGDNESFDGRYFGPVRADRVIGRAILAWPS